LEGIAVITEPLAAGQEIKTSFGYVRILAITNGFVRFIKHCADSLHMPICSSFMTPDEFIDFVNSNKPVVFVVHSQRVYGQPKLKKPKELGGVRQTYSAAFNHKCKCQCYVLGNDLWIKHRDWFSETWQPPEGERIDMTMGYYMRKYFNRDIPNKFIYDDTWGDIVLRNEAWLRIENVISVMRSESVITSRAVVLQAMASALGLNYYDLCASHWERFIEGTVSQFQKHIKTPAESVQVLL
jgi:hypothetical protein